MTGRGELDYGLGETIGLLRESVRGFVEDEISPLVAASEQEGFFPPRLWREMGMLGLLGITVPAEFGGAGLGYLEHVVVMEEISRVSAALGLTYCTHSNLCGNQFYRNGTEEQKRRYLPRLISGETIGALALSGVEAGPDVPSIDLRAEKHGDFYHLNGSTWVLAGRPDADVLLVFAGTSTSLMVPVLSAFIVEKAASDFQTRIKVNMTALQGTPAFELIFDNFPVSEQNLLGEAGQGAHVMTRSRDFLHPILAGGPLGIMAACFDLLLPARQRHKQLGRSGPEVQVMMQRAIADMYATWCACRSYVYTVARAADWGAFERRDGAAVLVYAAERAIRMAFEVVRLLGCNGRPGEYPAGRLLCQAKFFARGAATGERRRLLVVEGLFPEQEPQNSEIFQPYTSSIHPARSSYNSPTES